MGNDRGLRRLVIDERTAYDWTLRHSHGEDGACRETLTLYRDRHTATRIVFRSGEGRYVAEGYWYSGSVTDGHGNLLNLHEPGVVRAFVDEADRRGLLAEPGAGTVEVDGWELFRAVVRGRAALA
ncbi:hypothetical protein [Streptomyces broussonetiae]|uniref:Uncharacterized protein n=1 Tax=Streptomyces broussonetiae TaxID=2686304 RepID=A0ABV5E3L2_9ACTN